MMNNINNINSGSGSSVSNIPPQSSSSSSSSLSTTITTTPATSSTPHHSHHHHHQPLTLAGSTTGNSYPQGPNELIHAIIHGTNNTTKTIVGVGFPEPPTRVIKIFISSTKTDFEYERQHLHEIVLPKLERYLNQLSLDLLCIDPYWQMQPPPPLTNSFNNSSSNSSNNNTSNASCKCDVQQQQQQQSSMSNIRQPIKYDYNLNCIDPHEFQLQMNEIEECCHKSLATFFMCLIGHKYRPIALPTVIPSNDFQQIFTAAAESGLGDVNLLRSCYKENRNLQPEPHYVLLEPRRASHQYEEELEHIAKLVEYGSKVAAREGLLSSGFGMVMSAVHQQTLHALYCARQHQPGMNQISPTTLTTSGGHRGGHRKVTPTTSGGGLIRTPKHTKPSATINHSDVFDVTKTPPTTTTTTTTTTSDISSTTKPSSSSPLSSMNNKTPTKRLNRLIHQGSLQQGPTQQKISMPLRQSSVSTNYDLLQQPVDRILCFIRQLEGVNFNNASVQRFFDVTPTAISLSPEQQQQQQQQSNTPTGSGGSLPVPVQSSNQQQQQQTSIKQLYAPAAQNDIQQLIEDVILGLRKGNVHYFNISWSPPPDHNNLQTRTYTLPANYIEKFGETVYRTLRQSIDEHLNVLQHSIYGNLSSSTTSGLGAGTGAGGPITNGLEYPGDIVREAHSHLSNIRRVMGALGMAQAINHSDFGHLLHIRELLIADLNTGVTGTGNRSTTTPQATRHQPIIISGRSGSGKSTLLAQVFTYAPEWLAESCERDQVIRIVRQCGQSPSSNFASELLRSLCIQISIAYGLESHLNRSTAAHELSELAICFQELLKLRNNPNCDLLIILDDLHHLQSALQSSALLGWMPWNLPINVHFICSVALESDSVLSILRSRISAENFIQLDHQDNNVGLENNMSIINMVQSKLRDEKRTLTTSQWDFVKSQMKQSTINNNNNRSNDMTTPLFANMLATALLTNWESFYQPEYFPTSVSELVNMILDDIEECLPYQLVRRICCYLTCTKYGLRETELYNLVQETLTNQIWPAMVNSQQQQQQQQTSNEELYDPPRSTGSIWIIMKSKMKHLLKEYYVQGQLYFNWRSSKVSKAIQERYLVDINYRRSIHNELAMAFSNSFMEQLNMPGKETTESVREADELWYHLLYSANKSLLKTQALLNVRFLNCIVQGVSVCYLRCILDAVRSQILDWHIELLYAMLKQSVHVITQESNQFPVEILLWLIPFASPGTLTLNQLIMKSTQTTNVVEKKKSNTYIYNTMNNIIVPNHLLEFIRQCYQSCVIENNDRPLLHPINIWLNLPIPPQLTMITTPWQSITRAVSTNDSQHLIVCESNSLHIYHLPTKTIAKTLEGHKSTVTCLYLSIKTGKWLATGSDDNSVNLWYLDIDLMQMNDYRLCHIFNHHSSGVLCVTINHAETLVLSGSENGAICAVNLQSGQLITRLEHHKSMVTCIGINSGDDVLVSGSTDRTVVIWSLDTFCILNEILLMRPVLHMDISLDSTFLLLSLDDNSLQVRALTTGTGVHTLQPTGSVGTSSVITYVRFAEDNCRCVVGYADGRLVLFDIHSARQLHTLNGHSEMITSILPQKDDHFLITTGGNKIIIWNFYPVKRVDQQPQPPGAPVNELDKSMHDLNLSSMDMMMNQSMMMISPASGASGSSTINIDSSSFDGITSTGKDGKDVKDGSGTGATGSGGSGRNSRSSSDRRKHKSSSSSSTHSSFRKKVSVSSIENHREPITCVCVSRDGQYVVSGGRDCLVKIWYCSTAETHTTLDESQAPITSVDITPNGQLVLCASEDGLVRCWSLTLSMYVSKMAEHCPHSVMVVKALSDNKRALSADVNQLIRLWLVDSGQIIKVIYHKPITGLYVHGGTCFGIGGKIDNCVKYWQIFEPETTEKSVSHSDTITCFCCTHSGKILITGSQDMSLKVWETSTGKLTQVLVGHEGAISCVATAPLDETLVVSGSQDCNLIVWDMNTGTDLYTLMGHNANVLGVQLTPDGSRALSYSEDNTIQLWDIKHGQGTRLSMLDIHHNIAHVYSSVSGTYMAVWLGCSSHILPIIKHHNNCCPQNIIVELPPVGTPTTAPPTTTSGTEMDIKSSAWLRGLMPSRNASAVLAARTLKREQSFDSFYFEHMLHRGQSVDDFRKISALSGVGGGGGGLASSLASPFGSREQLWTGSSSTSGHDDIKSTSSGRSRMISKLMNIGGGGPNKQKMLKKQQSMFACFPEFTNVGKQSIASSGNAGTVTGTGTGNVQDSSLTQQVNGSIVVGKKISMVNSKIYPIGTTNISTSSTSITTTGTATNIGTTITRASTSTSIGKSSSIDKEDLTIDQQQQQNPKSQITSATNVMKDSSVCVIS